MRSNLPRRLVAGAFAAATLAVAPAVSAQVAIKDAWVRATVPQQKATGAFMTIVAQKDTRLVAVRSARTPHVEVHEMRRDKDRMQMREIAGLDIMAGKPMALKPGGYHVMLMSLPTQVKAGEAVPLTLDFVDRDGHKHSVDVTATVKPLAAPAAR